MNRRLFELAEHSEGSVDDTTCKNCSQSTENVIPECLNGDYCVSSPASMNGGILTLAFVDIQPLDTVYQTDTAFCRGTLFPNLDKPFFGRMQK